MKRFRIARFDTKLDLKKATTTCEEITCSNMIQHETLLNLFFTKGIALQRNLFIVTLQGGDMPICLSAAMWAMPQHISLKLFATCAHKA